MSTRTKRPQSSPSARKKAPPRGSQRPAFVTYDPPAPDILHAGFAEAKVTTTRACEPAPPLCNTPEIATRLWHEHVTTAPWFDSEKECLVLFALNARNECRHLFLVSIGTVNEVLAHPREILRPLVMSAAFAFIALHNHPSGNPEPSATDRRLTRRLRVLSRLVQIHMLDHVIVAGSGPRLSFYSFTEEANERAEIAA
jgi:proteasome lid subunit RPN8/RPN11